MDVQSENENSRQKGHLKMLCETRCLEKHNRRENVRLTGIQQKTSTDVNIRTTHGFFDETIQRVVESFHVCEAEVNDNHISIAHRFPSRKPSQHPIIVRWERTTGKLQLLKNKKQQASQNGYGNVKTFEDLTAPRNRFSNFWKTDTRMSTTWTCEGTIYLAWESDNKLYSASTLWRWLLSAQYKVNTRMSCLKTEKLQATLPWQSSTAAKFVHDKKINQ